MYGCPEAPGVARWRGATGSGRNPWRVEPGLPAVGPAPRLPPDAAPVVGVPTGARPFPRGRAPSRRPRPALGRCCSPAVAVGLEPTVKSPPARAFEVYVMVSSGGRELSSPWVARAPERLRPPLNGVDLCGDAEHLLDLRCVAGGVGKGSIHCRRESDARIVLDQLHPVADCGGEGNFDDSRWPGGRLR